MSRHRNRADGPKRARALIAGALTSGTFIVGAVGQAPQAEATCLSVSGLALGSGCYSAPFAVAIGLGRGATARADSPFSIAIGVGSGAASQANNPLVVALSGPAVTRLAPISSTGPAIGSLDAVFRHIDEVVREFLNSLLPPGNPRSRAQAPADKAAADKAPADKAADKAPADKAAADRAALDQARKSAAEARAAVIDGLMKFADVEVSNANYGKYLHAQESLDKAQALYDKVVPGDTTAAPEGAEQKAPLDRAIKEAVEAGQRRETARDTGPLDNYFTSDQANYDAVERLRKANTEYEAKAPADKAPAEKAPAEKAPAEKAPADKAPADTAKGDKTPADVVKKKAALDVAKAALDQSLQAEDAALAAAQAAQAGQSSDAGPKLVELQQAKERYKAALAGANQAQADYDAAIGAQASTHTQETRVAEDAAEVPTAPAANAQDPAPSVLDSAPDPYVPIARSEPSATQADSSVLGVMGEPTVIDKPNTGRQARVRNDVSAEPDAGSTMDARNAPAEDQDADTLGRHCADRTYSGRPTESTSDKGEDNGVDVNAADPGQGAAAH
jgi:hypothetical protein